MSFGAQHGIEDEQQVEHAAVTAGLARLPLARNRK